jgi:hypothetical protein
MTGSIKNAAGAAFAAFLSHVDRMIPLLPEEPYSLL